MNPSKWRLKEQSQGNSERENERYFLCCVSRRWDSVNDQILNRRWCVCIRYWACSSRKFSSKTCDESILERKDGLAMCLKGNEFHGSITCA